MTQKKQSIPLILRIATAVILAVFVIVLAYYMPSQVTPHHNFSLQTNTISLDKHHASYWEHLLTEEGYSQCHYHDSIYHANSQCNRHMCYTDDNVTTFNNQLMIENANLWTDKFLNQLYDINTSIINYIVNNSIPLLPTRIDLNPSRGVASKQKIINQYWEILKQNINIYWIHLTLNYFCCYTAKEYDIIIDAMKLFDFEPFDIGFDRYLCVGDEKNNQINIVLFVDSLSQQYLARLTDEIEEYLRDDYMINIHSHRRDEQPFHITLLSVDNNIVNSENQQYTLELVEYLNKNYNWDTIKLTINKSYVCLNDNEKYGIHYTCF